MRRDLPLILSASAALAACGDGPSAPALAHRDAIAAGRQAPGCIATAQVASSESQLNALLASANPGDVVAVSGTVIITDAVRPPTGVTLTCAAPGDGIAAAPGYKHFDLIEVAVPDVTVQGLTIASAPVPWPIYVVRSPLAIDGTPANGVNARVIGNTVACGTAGCAFFIGSANSVVADNRFAANGSATGIHMQGSGAHRVDGMRVERNVIVAARASGALAFGAIRPRDGSDIVLRDNQISGPWSNGIATTALSGSVFERNTVDGATRFGLFVGSVGGSNAAIQVRGLLARGNRLTGATNALHVNATCGSVFVANELASTGAVPAFFTATTGANNLLGYTGVVVDNGTADCDGDGAADPNFVSGRKRAGADPGETMQDVMPHAGRIQMH